MSATGHEAGGKLAEPLPDGIVPETMVVSTERRWLFVVTAVMAVMVGVIVVSGLTNGLHPPSNVETIDPTQVYQSSEFSESNLGTALNANGSATVRMIGQQYSFVPQCVTIPRGALVTFRLTSADVIHGFLIASTNVNTMVVPGYVSQVSAHFERVGSYHMPCDEYCGTGHAGMAAEVRVVEWDAFPALTPTERMSCATK